MYTVYAHINKINRKIYIGITSQNPLKRWNNGEGYRHCSHFYKAIKKYGWDNFEHKIIITDVSKQFAEDFEKYLIKTLDTIKSGYNIESGGSACKQLSEETKAKISTANKGRKMKPEQIEKMAKHKRNVKLSTEHKRKISEGLSKYYIVQYDALGNIVKKFRTISDAVTETKLSQGAIYRNINNQTKKKLLKGYKWKKELIYEQNYIA